MDYREVALEEVRKLGSFCKTVIDRVRGNLSLEFLKEHCDDLVLRAGQIRESGKGVRQCLKRKRNFPDNVIDLILKFMFTSIAEAIIEWQSSAFTEVWKANTCGYPPHAFERMNPQKYTEHRVEVDVDQLTEHEKFAFSINNAIIDEIELVDAKQISLYKEWDWIVIFPCYDFDGDGEAFCWLATIGTFTVYEAHDYSLEIGRRCEIPTHEVRTFAQFIHNHSLSMNILTGEVVLESLSA